MAPERGLSGARPRSQGRRDKVLPFSEHPCQWQEAARPGILSPRGHPSPEDWPLAATYLIFQYGFKHLLYKNSRLLVFNPAGTHPSTFRLASWHLRTWRRRQVDSTPWASLVWTHMTTSTRVLGLQKVGESTVASSPL